MGEVVVLSAVRTPIGDARKGPMALLQTWQLGEVAVRAALERSGVPGGAVDDIVLGEVMQGGGDIARYLAVHLGLHRVPGVAVQRHCASGMQAVAAAAAEIRCGNAGVVVAGGVESMSRTPQTFIPRPGPFSGVEPWISLSHPEDPEAPPLNMGITVGENTAVECGITREEQDEWAYHSHRRAVAATDDGRFAAEIVPVEVPTRKGTIRVEVDEHPRRDTSLEALAKLPPVFRPDGTVTAGNSSSLNDGAAALVLADADVAAANGWQPLAVIRSWAAVGIEPRRTGLAPTLAVPAALARAGIEAEDVQLVEINEAFASMAVACSRILGFPHEMVNVNGGAIALGHPVACSGARILVTLIHELRRRGGGFGLATLCAGGGMGMATVVEVL